MDSLHFAANLLPGSDSGLIKRLQEIASKLNRRKYVWPSNFLPLSSNKIQEICVGPNHAAFLLKDGTVCRVSLSIFGDRLGGKEPSASGKRQDGTSGGGGGSGGASGGSGRPPKTRRIAVMRTGSSRGARSARGVIVGSRALLPASIIPEELIAQAQVVLQGKSRDVIVRELQRTNLDVNQAVNNLLSRDDEDGDDLGDASDSYLPEELINLLDANLEHPSVIIDADSIYADDVFGLAGFRRRAAERSADKPETGERDSNAKLEVPVLSPIIPGIHLEFWNDGSTEQLSFKHIVATYSELVGVSQAGDLYRWRWCDERPERDSQDPPKFVVHPRLSSLGLTEEKISHISSSLIRITILTESNKVASFMDESLGPDVTQMLDTPCVEVPEPVTEVKTGTVNSCAVLKNKNTVYWWGVLPFAMRRKQWDKTKFKLKKQITADMTEIVFGSQVRLRSNPLYQAGSVGFTTVNGYPQVGTLMEAAWTLTETCRFKIKDARELTAKVKPPDVEMKPAADSVFPEPPSEQSNPSEDDNSLGSNLSMAPYLEDSSEPGRGIYAELRRRMKRQASLRDDSVVSKEDAWNLKDVIFVDEAKPLVTGQVVMVDGAYCAVIFPDKTGKISEDSQEMLKSCRLLRKDDLQVFRAGVVPKSPDCVQREPKKLVLTRKDVILDIALDTRGIQMLVQVSDDRFSLVCCGFSGKVFQQSLFPSSASAFAGTGRSKPQLINYGEEEFSVLLDGNCCVYPLEKDCTGGIKDPVPVSLPPVISIGLGIHPLKNQSGSLSKRNRATVLVFLVKSSVLMEHVLHCDVEQVKIFIEQLEREKNLDQAQEEILNSRISCNRNILHACVFAMIPPSNKESIDATTSASTGTATSTPSLAERTSQSVRNFYDTQWEQLIGSMNFDGSANSNSDNAGERNEQRQRPSAASQRSSSLIMDMTLPALSWPSAVPDMPGIDPLNVAKIAVPPLPSMPKAVYDWKERQQCAMQILKFLCDNSFMTLYLLELLSAKDSNGLTPFMYAVRNRVYPAALLLFDTAQRLARATTQYKESFMTMICPTGTNPEDSPLHLLTCNDTCSFTWTGDDHINQDIFECKTCGLVETLCCCTECANVCHKGHDCKLKRTSPTAYCDCWERCKCQALIAGNQTARFELLERFLAETDLVARPNKVGEHLLLFLVRTASRQISEQRQYRPNRSKTQKPPRPDVGKRVVDQKGKLDSDMPENDLEPPRFARRALERLLNDWFSVKTMVLMGSQTDSIKNKLLYEDQFYLYSQDGASHLDRFTHCLIVKCSQEMLDTLVTTLIREISSPGRGKKEAEAVASRFIRSVIRIYVSLTSTSVLTPGKRKTSSMTNKCTQVFQSLLHLSVRELAEAANALMAPVRLGVLKPLSQFNLASTTSDLTEQVFAMGSLPSGPFDQQSIPMESGLDSMDVLENSQSEPDVGESDTDEEEESVTRNVSPVISRSLPVTSSVSRTPAAHSNARGAVAASEPSAGSGSGASRSAARDDLMPGAHRQLSGPGAGSGSSERRSRAERRSGGGGGAVSEGEGETAEQGYYSEDQDSVDSEEGVGGHGDVDMRVDGDGEDGGEGEHDDDSDDSSDAGEVVPDSEPDTPDRNRRTDGDENDAANVNRTTAPSTARLVWAVARRQRDRDRLEGNTAAPSRRLDAAGESLTASSRDIGRRNFIYLDSGSLRRSSMLALTNALDLSRESSTANLDTSPSTIHTASLLARSFGILVRQLVDLLKLAYDYKPRVMPRMLTVTSDEASNLQTFVESKLLPTWTWLFCILDSVEAKLRFGASLAVSSNGAIAPVVLASQAGAGGGTSGSQATPGTSASSSLGDPRRPATRNKIGESESRTTVAARDFLQYAMSLLRAHFGEHYDDIPVLDLSSMKHLAHAVDAVFYYVKKAPSVTELTATTSEPAASVSVNVAAEKPSLIDSVVEPHEHMDIWAASPVPLDTEEDDNSNSLPQPPTNPNHSFFKRSKSMIYPGLRSQCGAFELSVADSIPLADAPPILQPDAEASKLFGLRPKQKTWDEHVAAAANLGNPAPTFMGFSEQSTMPDEPVPSLVAEESLVTEGSARKPTEAAESKDVPKSANEPVQCTEASTVEIRMETDTPATSEPTKASDEVPRVQSVIVHSSALNSGKTDDTAATSSDKVTPGTATSSGSEKLGGHDNLPRNMERRWLGQEQDLMSRWPMTLTALSRLFHADAGQEPGSTLIELAGFAVRESRFRKEMEKLRSHQNKDLTLEVDREPSLLLQQTIKQLNQCYNRRYGLSSTPIMAVQKVKVAFKDEPGEGSGVARSFYAAIAEAILNLEKLPNLEQCQVGTASSRVQHQLLNRLRNREREREMARRRSGYSSTRRYPLSLDAPVFSPRAEGGSGEERSASGHEDGEASRMAIGERLYPRVRNLRPSLACKITGMLLALPPHQILVLLANEESLAVHVEEAADMILAQQGHSERAEGDSSSGGPEKIPLPTGEPPKSAASTPTTAKSQQSDRLEDLIDDAPLFFNPNNSNFYTPRVGKKSPERLNAFRNVGRLIGMCLLQNEMFPLRLCRHVLKFVLGRPITWFDLAFYDAELFESLRLVALDPDVQEADLVFAIDLLQEEGGGRLELKPGGSDIPVTSKNVLEFIQLYVEQRLIKIPEKTLEQLKQGVHDVLPSHALSGLTAEDIRLILNGVNDVDVNLLRSFTSYSDESNALPDDIARCKKWFWQTVERMTPGERHDLVYFWTGSPGLPSSEEGFQPLPSILIRPADDHHLPTANTCISRLYLPLYSSRQVMSQKLLMAIKARNFGFV